MKENSIEEAIERLEYIDRAYSCNNYYSIWDLKCIEILLSDYKRVLKENEILKEEKEQAWEEWNNLEQGSYETEQKLKQQIKKLQKEKKELELEIKNREFSHMNLYNEYKYYKQFKSLSIETIKNKIEYLDKQQADGIEDRELKVSDSEIIFARDTLEKLLEDNYEKF